MKYCSGIDTKGRTRARYSAGWAMLALCLGVVSPLQAKSNRPPNFVVIFVDDMGYADAGAFGSRVHRTPSLDRIAKEVATPKALTQ